MLQWVVCLLGCALALWLTQTTFIPMPKNQLQVILEDAYTYESYRDLLQDSVQDDATPLYDDAQLMDYTKLNLKRIERVEKTTPLSQEVRDAAGQLTRDVVWLVLTEGWCGDAAHSLPIIADIASECPQIDLKIVMRDEHPQLMDQYLTNGSRSIPKLIALDPQTFETLGTWGPRPAPLQAQMSEWMKKLDGKDDGKGKDDIVEDVQKWYNGDKGKHIMKELAGLLKKLDA